jgi:hypothetical protein
VVLGYMRIFEDIEGNPVRRVDISQLVWTRGFQGFGVFGVSNWWAS